MSIFSCNISRTNAVIARLCCVVAIAASISHSVFASSLFDNTASNIWVFDQNTGAQVATFDISGGANWTRFASELSSSVVEIGAENGSTEIGSLDLSAQYVLVNNLNGSLQFFDTGLNVALPDMSMQGLQPATSTDSAPELPTIIATPSGGTFTKTTEVVLTATPDRNSPEGVFSFSIELNGVTSEFDVIVAEGENAEHKLYLLDGNYTLLAAVRNAGSQSSTLQANYTVVTVDGPFGDSDGDGIPDAVEVEWGGDPLTQDGTKDTDGDGWSDLEERLRGSDPADEGDEPLDTDGDGWPDKDELMRGTDPFIDFLPLKWTSKPAASRYTEVEYLVNGMVFEDVALTTPQVQITELTVFDVQWRRRYDQSQLLSEEGLSLTEPPIGGESELLPMFRKSEVEAALAIGQLPQDLRLPASTPMVMRVRQGDTSGGLEWTAKTWLGAQPDVTPQRYGEFAVANEISWNNASEWLTGYVNYFAANIVQPVTRNLSPATGDAVAVMEAAIAFHDPVSGPSPLLLGTLRGREAPLATLALENSLAKDNRTLQTLFTDIESLLGMPELQGVVTRSTGYYDGSLLLIGSTVSSSLARWLQFDATAEAQRYVSRLLTTLDLAFLNSLPNLERILLVSPGADADSDGVDNGIELTPVAALATNVLAADTDSDGYEDNLDPCPLDAVNACLGEPNSTADSDSDGVIDALDNCLRVSNANQADGDGDGIGDVCVRYANIAKPAADVTVLAGSSVAFTSIVSAVGASQTLSYDWNFGGAAANSSQPQPGLVTFSEAGNYQVTLTVNDQDLMNLGDDIRFITVLPVIVDTDNDGVPDYLDGFPNDPDNSGAIVQLVEGQLDPGSYGNGFGSGQHFNKLAAEFGGAASGRWLHIQGFDLDANDELAVYVNGSFVTVIAASGDNLAGNDSLVWLPGDALDTSVNRIELHQENASDSWGVMRLGLFIPGTLVGSAQPTVSNVSGFDIYPGADSTNLLEFVDESGTVNENLTWTLGSESLVGTPQQQIVYQLLLDFSRLLLADGPLRVSTPVTNQPWALRLDEVRALNFEFGLLPFPVGASAPQHVNQVTYLLPEDSLARVFNIEFLDVTTLGEVTLKVDQGAAENVPVTPSGVWGSAQQIVTHVDLSTTVTLTSTLLPAEVWAVRAISFDELADSDLDGIDDDLDNCSLTANATQADSDIDGLGNACDPDVNNDCVVNFLDLAAFSNEFLGSNPVFDFNDDGAVNFLDLIVLRSYFLQPPGPSGISNICN